MHIYKYYININILNEIFLMKMSFFYGVVLLMMVVIEGWACVAGVGSCVRCVDADTCGECYLGSGLYSYDSGGVITTACQPCLANCRSCVYSSTCNQCYANYRLNVNGGCDPCTAPSCY